MDAPQLKAKNTKTNPRIDPYIQLNDLFNEPIVNSSPKIIQIMVKRARIMFEKKNTFVAFF